MSSSDTLVQIPVGGMTCAACQAHVQRALAEEPGVVDASVNLMMQNAAVRYDPSRVTPDRLVEAIRESGYEAALPNPDRSAIEDQLALDAAQAHEVTVLTRKVAVSLTAGALGMLAMPLMGHSTVLPWALLGLTLLVMVWAGRH